MDGNSYIDAGTADMLEDIRLDLFATSYAMQDPKLLIRFFRRGVPVGEPVPVIYRSVVQALRDARSGEGAVGTFATGELWRPAPWDIAVGDAFRIGDGDATVVEVPPARKGRQVVRFRMNADAGGAPS